MSPPPSLLGPPEIQSIGFSFSEGATKKPKMGVTENNSATYLASGNPCLDFFFHVVPDTPREEVVGRLQVAWNHDPLTTLKLICHLRGVRGTGKCDKGGFYTAALWLHENHPKTLSINVPQIADFGYFKDMMEILYRIIEGPDVREAEELKWEERKCEILESKRDRKKHGKGQAKAKMERLKKIVEKAKKAIEIYSKNENYRFLHDSISDLFSKLLKKDLENLNHGNLKEIGLASKWCPSLDSSYDRSTLMCESLARKMFPKDDFMEYEDMEDRHYAYRVRDRLRKEVLVPLHKALELPEVYMCAKKWDELPYNRVPSIAMKNYYNLFFKHDKERFEKYLLDVKNGKTTIAAGALLPHEIIAQVDDPEAVEVAELQWKRMVDDIAKKGSLENCMAICDVSSSMSGTPMEVSVALGLLISELSEVPWKNKLITFSENPEFHVIKGDSLKKKTNFIRRMEWGGNTDFQKVFDQILKVAVRGKLREDQMIRRLFVFSDMEFDQASSSASRWETDYQAIQRKFHAKGYQNVPEIVFWNLRNSRATPVPSNQPGVALVSGFSKNLVSVFLEEGGIMSPEAVMLQSISGEEYQKLIVYD
ncbi:hypothetical protein LIER_03861 [Lithospermum erythrorhizon]|uniref:Uncharacterized protein n=1 Tax=Lithospermum erythrorhizon TaxID=34254 RepID=A0AAV3NUU8_LITER